MLRILNIDTSQKHFEDPVTVAHEIKERIKEDLGFSVNVGIGPNKLLSKMTSELKKPDMVHTLYPKEIERHCLNTMACWYGPMRMVLMIPK